MDDLRHFPYAPGDKRAFGRNDSELGHRDAAFKPANKPVHGAFGRDYHREVYPVQMRDLHHARGIRGHYNDHPGKSAGDEEMGRERDRYNERERNRDWQCDPDNRRSDISREYSMKRGGDDIGRNSMD